ncbi:MAG: toll/interleukin-1 receptor domain-containing protein, partial [Anaerolineae bacterium]|nr:toll/interleukin-1 receptor domain-containing protein [Anaerolineae bacterium]
MMPTSSHWNALRKIVERLPANLAYYGSALGAIVLAGGGQLPPGLEFVAGSIGGNMLSNIIADILKDEELLDDEIRQRAEDAITQSDIANLLTKQDFLQGYARLIQRLDAQKTISQDILDELRIGFSKVATADQVEELKRLILQLMPQSPQTAPRKVPLFISYARKDGRTFAAELRKQLTAEGFTIWQDVVSLPPGEQWWLKIKEAIDSVQTMILILSDAALDSSVVRREWAYARSVGIQIIPVAQDAGIYDKSPRWVSKHDVPNLDKQGDDYANNWSRLLGALRNPPLRQRIPFMVEPLTDYFAERPELQTRITDQLLDETHLEPRQGETVALLGAGGFGKTTM